MLVPGAFTAKSTAIVLAISVSGIAVGQNVPAKKAHVEVETVKQTDGTELQFKVTAADGMLLTFEAPWSLKIESLSGASPEKTKFSKKDMNESLPGFKVKMTPVKGSKSGKVDYKMITFACTKDKKQCFRESHQQSFSFNQ